MRKVALVLAVVFLVGCGSTSYNTATSQIEPAAPIMEEQAEEPVEEEPVKEETEDDRSVFYSEMGIDDMLFHENVYNDNTGNYRVAVIYSAVPVHEHIETYYGTFVKSDTERHFIVNLYLKTTTSPFRMGNMIDCSVHEYVKGEENNADLLNTGEWYGDYFIDTDTGEITFESATAQMEEFQD